jgi:LPS-assembly lipoprotein
MSWPDLRRSLIAAAAGFLLAGLAACTVQPLHGGGPAGPVSSQLSAIHVSPVDTRQALEVRNHLIFLLGGGAGQPASPAWKLDLDVHSRVSETALIQIGKDNEPSAGTVILSANWRLRDAASGETVASGRRVAQASYDRMRQEFANVRAVRDAENRAARELAEMLRLALAQEVARLGR